MVDEGGRSVGRVCSSVQVHRLSTSAVPAADRLDFWQATVSASLQPVQLSPVCGDGRSFEAEVLRVDAGSAKITRGSLHPVRSVQTATAARQQSGTTLQVTLLETGRMTVASGSGVHEITGRSLLLQSDDAPVTHTHLERTGLVLLTVDADRLSIPLAALRRAMNVPLPVDPMLRALVLGAVETARHAGATTDATGMAAYLSGVAELVVRGVTGRPEDHAGGAQVRRQQVREVVAAQHHDPHLTVGVVAERIGVSVRRLHQLFADGPSVTEQIRTARLDHAVALLRDPAWSAHPVGAVARRCGFLDHSVFSRAFREHTGSTPSVFRC